MLSTVEKTVIKELSQHFDKSIDISNRVRVISDLYKFNWKEDLSVWGQKKGKVLPYYSVYFDDEFVVGFTEEWTIQQFMVEFWKALKKLYKENKIILNKHLADQAKIDEQLKKKDVKIKEKKRIDKLPEDTEIEKLAKEAVKRVSRKKKKHTSLASSKPNA